MMMLSNLYKTAICILILSSIQIPLWSQDDTTEIVRKPFIVLRYFNIQNQNQYLLLQCQLKIDKKVEPLANLNATIYLDDETDESNLIARVVTNKEGKASAIIPSTLKDKWLASTQHKFIAITDSISNIGVRESETEITIARISLDTIEDAETRSVQVRVEELKDSQWLPATDVEVKVGIKRLGSILPLGEDETVTTDSTGTATAEFNKDSLPGDESGNLILIARVEDNDLYGNLEFEKSAPWGKELKYESDFGKRSLWATGDKIPIWLLSIAFLIIFSVWGTLIYLIFRLLKIRKLGLR
jgi:hypothetical protein